jgi:DNA repair photolyase
MSAKSAIYEPSGPAREYCHLALNHYSGCRHGCTYCYVPGITHQNPFHFRNQVQPRLTVEEIENSAALYADDNRPILMSFLSDPYPGIEASHMLTRGAIEIFHKFGLSFAVLTKAGSLPQRDFSLYRPGDSFAVTMTFMDENKSRHWEPHAALPAARLENLRAAHEAGIPTWVSLEPVIERMETVSCIIAAAPFTDHFKLGKMNHSSMSQFDEKTWQTFITRAIGTFRHYKKGFYIKSSLSNYIDEPGGYAEGLQMPMTVVQANELEMV